MQDLADRYSERQNWLYLGRGVNSPVALEGALKLKEVRHIHAEGLPAAELKCGPSGPVWIGNDVTILPHSTIQGAVSIGPGCVSRWSIKCGLSWRPRSIWKVVPVAPALLHPTNIRLTHSERIATRHGSPLCFPRLDRSRPRLSAPRPADILKKIRDSVHSLQIASF